MTAPTTPVQPRDPAWAVLNAVRTCTATQLGLIRRPVITFPIVFGERPPPADNCACTGPNGATGSAWTRIVPQRLNLDPRFASSGCAGGRWLHDLEVGIYRCWPTTSNQNTGAPPTQKQYDTAAKGIYDDAAALRRVPRCCTWLTERDVTVTSTQVNAVGPMGGCVAVVLTATVPLDECLCPDMPAAQTGLGPR